MNKKQIIILIFAICAVINFINLNNLKNRQLPESSNPIQKEDSANSEEEEKTLTTEAKEIKYIPTNNAGNYLKYAVDSKGNIVKWNKEQLFVFIENSPYKNIISKTFSDYNTQFSNYFKFIPTNEKNNADITVETVPHIYEKDNSHYFSEGRTYTNQSYKTAELTSAKIQLAYKDNFDNNISEEKMYQTALHEIGHAIGIIGHSQDETDLMYGFSNSHNKTFSKRDINTIKLLYSNDKKAIAAEKSGFADSKLQEAIAYAKKNPNKTLVWINLGQVYYDLGYPDKSLEAYKTALSLDSEDSQVYKAIAQCYYVSEKYDSAIKFYTYANKYSSQDYDQNLEMIGICYMKKEKYHEAINCFKEVYYKNPTKKEYLNNLISATLQIENKTETKNAIEKYISQGKTLAGDENLEEAYHWASQ